MGLLDKFFPTPRKAPTPSSQTPFSKPKPSSPNQGKSPGKNPSSQRPTSSCPQQPHSPFQNNYYVPSDRFKNWLYEKWPSPSEVNILRQKFEQYWPSSAGSLDRNSINTLKQKLWRDANYADRIEDRRTADKLLKAIEKFERGE